MIYYRAVKAGKRMLEDVPQRWREQVRELLGAEAGE